MISLVVPTESETRYLRFGDHAFGPYDPNYMFSGQAIAYRPKEETMSESRGLYDENNVDHIKFAGNILVHPLIGCATLANTVQYPHQIRVPIYNLMYNPKLSTTLLFPVGIAFNNCIRRFLGYFSGTPSSNTLITTYAFFHDNDSKIWSLYEVLSYYGNPSRIYAFSRFDYLSYRNGSYTYQVKASRRTRRYKMPSIGWLETGINFGTNLNWSDFEPLISQFTTTTYDATADVTGTIYEGRLTSAYSPSVTAEIIDALITKFDSDFPIEDEPYGDMALRASQQLNLVDTNMISFLLDLRDLKDLPSKLKNLKRFKGFKLPRKKTKALSNAYLSTIYGTLPTIDDMKRIISAFKSKTFLVDRQNWRTIFATHTDSAKIGDLSYFLEQHIKIAIGEEDNEFELLIERIQSLGALPTFENLWDLVPYSFVLDWFVDVGGLLERVDFGLRVSRLNIKYVTSSRRTSTIGQLPKDVLSPVDGHIELVHYHRWVSDQCPVPPLELKLETGPFQHWLEAGALIIQRL